MSAFIHIVNYTAIPATETFHRVPRFGHSNNFANLFSEDKSVQTNYVKGIIFTGVLIFTFFLVWLILLSVLKCLGERVGFFSGARMMDPGTRKDTGGCTRRPSKIRIIFCLSTVIVIVFAVVLETKGLADLRNTTNSLEQSNSEVAFILQEFQTIANNIRSIGASANQTRAKVLAKLNNFCPDGPNLQQRTGVNFPVIGTRTSRLLRLLGDFIGAELDSFQQSLTEAQHTSDNLDKALNTFDFHALALSFVIIYLVLPTFMLLGVLLAWFGFSNSRIQCLLSWFVLPMWIIMMMVGIVCTALSAWMVAANADFCSGGTASTPDDTLKQILNVRNVTLADILGQVAYYYITQCRTQDPWAFLQTFQVNLTSANDTVNTLAADVNQVGFTTLDSTCGGDFSVFEHLLLSLQSSMSELILDVKLARELLACNNIVPIYTTTMYNTACDYSVLALAWCFAGFLVISFFGMIMITLRTSWNDVIYINDYEAKNVEPDVYLESAAPDDKEDLPAPSWNSSEKQEPVNDDGGGNRFEAQ